MKTRTYVAFAVTLLVVLAGVALVLINSRAASQSLMIPVTDPQMLDVAQIDEITKLERYPVAVFPSYTGELDAAQQDEVAKLAAYPIIFPSYTGNVESLLIAQDDNNPAQPTRHPISDLTGPLVVPVTGRVESLPASIDDYTPAQRAQYQITDPMP